MNKMILLLALTALANGCASLRAANQGKEQKVIRNSFGQLELITTDPRP